MATMGLMDNDDKRMTFTEHLGELRIRLIRSIVGIGIAFVLCFIFWEQLYKVLSYPLQTRGMEIPWITNNPLESMNVAVRLAGTFAAIICAPHILYEICAFVFPGLKPNERKLALTLIVGCSVLAVAGAAVAYFLVSPQLIGLMNQWTPEGVKQQLQMSPTIAFEIFLLLAFAVAFQFPMVVLILVYLGIVSQQTLRAYRRYAFVLLAVAAAALTPTTDPFSFAAMWVPLVLMYEACVWIAYVIDRKKPA
ncbi:MAG: twin-arginine translocase subunit TatC [Candidatus Hydrogenedentes bacterium]|nr:twin-arginine translocase subunit TatC [Candidatus Hydrogenedentota bacterium]